MRHFIETKGSGGSSSRGALAADDLSPDTIDATFEARIQTAYAEPGAVTHIVPNLPEWVGQLRQAGIQIGLNTGCERARERERSTGVTNPRQPRSAASNHACQR